MFDLVSDVYLLAQFLSARRTIDLATTAGLQRERHNGSQKVTVTWLVTARSLFVFCFRDLPYPFPTPLPPGPFFLFTFNSHLMAPCPCPLLDPIIEPPCESKCLLPIITTSAVFFFHSFASWVLGRPLRSSLLLLVLHAIRR